MSRPVVDPLKWADVSAETFPPMPVPPRPGRLRRSWAFVGRHRAALILLTAAVLAVVGLRSVLVGGVAEQGTVASPATQNAPGPGGAPEAGTAPDDADTAGGDADTSGDGVPVPEPDPTGDGPAGQARAWVSDQLGDAEVLDVVALGVQGDADAAVAAAGGWEDVDAIVVGTDTTPAELTDPGGAAGVALTHAVTRATFGEGDTAVDVRLVRSEGIVPALEADSRLDRSRAALGPALTADPGVVVADEELRTALEQDTDVRALRVLQELAAAGPVEVDGLPVVDGESGWPRRQVELGGDDATLDAVETQLEQLDEPFAPQQAERTDAGLLLGWSPAEPVEALADEGLG